MKLTAPPKYQPGYVAAAITAYLEGEARVRDEAILAEGMTRIKRTIMKQLMKKRDDRKGHESNSVYIKKCARQAQFSYRGVERPQLPARTILKFLLGDIVELNVLLIAKLAGLDIGLNNEDVSVTGRDGKEIQVHPDGLYHHGTGVKVNYNIECKSSDSKTFDRWVNNGGPDDDFGYLTQASVEIAAWREAGVDVDYTNFIAVSTGSRIGSVEDWIIPYDQSLVDAWHARRALVLGADLAPMAYEPVPETEYVAGKEPKQLLSAAANGIPCAPREGAKGIYGWDIPTGRQILPTACSYCDYKAQCFPSAVMEVQGDRPVWVVPRALRGEPELLQAECGASVGSTCETDAGIPTIPAPTDLHPMACSGPEAWEAWMNDVWAEHKAEFADAEAKLGLNSVKYDDLTEAHRSAFAYSVEDRIAWAAKGLATKKKGRRR